MSFRPWEISLARCCSSLSQLVSFLLRKSTAVSTFHDWLPGRFVYEQLHRCDSSSVGDCACGCLLSRVLLLHDLDSRASGSLLLCDSPGYEFKGCTFNLTFLREPRLLWDLRHQRTYSSIWSAVRCSELAELKLMKWPQKLVCFLKESCCTLDSQAHQLSFAAFHTVRHWRMSKSHDCCWTNF